MDDAAAGQKETSGAAPSSTANPANPPDQQLHGGLRRQAGVSAMSLPPILPQMTVGQALATSSSYDGGGQQQQRQRQRQQHTPGEGAPTNQHPAGGVGAAGSQLGQGRFNQQNLTQTQHRTQTTYDMRRGGGMMIPPNNMSMFPPIGMGGIGTGGGIGGMTGMRPAALQQHQMQQQHRFQQQRQQMASMMQQQQMLEQQLQQQMMMNQSMIGQHSTLQQSGTTSTPATNSSAAALPSAQSQPKQPQPSQPQHAQQTQKQSQPPPNPKLAMIEAETEALRRRLEYEETKKRKREEQAASAAASHAHQEAQAQSDRRQQRQTASYTVDLTEEETRNAQEQGEGATTATAAAATSGKEQIDKTREERQRLLAEETRAAAIELKIEEEKLRQLQEALGLGDAIEYGIVEEMRGSHDAAASGPTDADASMPLSASTAGQGQPSTPTTISQPEAPQDNVIARAGGWHIPSKPRKYTKKQPPSKAKQSPRTDGPIKKRKPGRPLGSSTRAKHLDTSLVLPSSLVDLDLADLRASADFTMSPELAASIMAATKPKTPPKEVLPDSDCWVDPVQNNATRSRKKSAFIMPCSRPPDTVVNVSLASYRNQWNKTKESLENDSRRLSSEDSRRELLDRFSHDARVGCVSILQDESITGTYSINAQNEVLNRMEDRGYFTRRRQPATATAFPVSIRKDMANNSVQQRPAVRPAVRRSSQSSPESKVDYLSATPNLMMLPLEQNTSHPRQA